MKGLGGFRLRNHPREELQRLALQLLLILGFALALWCIAGSLILGEMPWHVPVRVVSDTFGPIEDLWNMHAPLLDRKRFESPGNMWRIVMFPPQTLLGSMQDFGYMIWNWGARSVYEGPKHARLLVMFLDVCAIYMVITWAPAMVGGMLVHGPGRPLGRMYMYYMPEQLLVLEQLAVARELFGRPLSPAVVEELELASSKHPRVKAAGKHDQ